MLASPLVSVDWIRETLAAYAWKLSGYAACSAAGPSDLTVCSLTQKLGGCRRSRMPLISEEQQLLDQAVLAAMTAGQLRPIQGCVRQTPCHRDQSH